MEVLDITQAPDSTDEQLRVSTYSRRVDDDATGPEIGEGGLIDIVLLIEGDTDLVDDPVAASLFDLRLHQLRLITVHVVLRKDLPDCLDACLDRRFVIGCRVLAEQVLKH